MYVTSFPVWARSSPSVQVGVGWPRPTGQPPRRFLRATSGQGIGGDALALHRLTNTSTAEVRPMTTAVADLARSARTAPPGDAMAPARVSRPRGPISSREYDATGVATA